MTIEDRTENIRIWHYPVKGVNDFVVPIFFLDTNLEENSEKFWINFLNVGRSPIIRYVKGIGSGSFFDIAKSPLVKLVRQFLEEDVEETGFENV